MKYFFKKTVLSLVLLVLPVLAIGQTLWSTAEMENTKHIPYKKVVREVTKLYDLYNYYYDQTGFSRKSFIEKLDDVEAQADWMINITPFTEEKEVNAYRIQIDGGSAIRVLYVDKNNVHVVIFSNVISPNFNMTQSSDRKQFKKWFKALLN